MFSCIDVKLDYGACLFLWGVDRVMLEILESYKAIINTFCYKFMEGS